MHEASGHIPPARAPFNRFAISRPDPVLMFDYGLTSLLAGPGFLFAREPLDCNYLTLRYHIDGGTTRQRRRSLRYTTP